MTRPFLTFLVTLAFGPATPVDAAIPAPPDQVAYSGVLVDGGGVPLAGPVALTARVYDAPSGGSLVFKQSFAGVALSDGHFSVFLGPTGAATDSPTNPLTTSLRTALTGDLAAGAGRFVEITVNSDPPLARVALVLVPYALRADHATTADVATNALDAQAVNGLDGVALGELFEHYTEDNGAGFSSTDPREGTADPDGDGEANFVDPDNDNDTHTDVTEKAQGWNPNLPTPWTGSVVPNVGPPNAQTQVTVTGASFLPGLTVTFGSQTFTPTTTPTTFSVTVGPQPSGTVNLVVTNPNGETSTQLNAFTFSGVVQPSAPVPLNGGWVPSAPIQIVARGEQLLATGMVTSGANRNRYSIDTVVDNNVAFDFGNVIAGVNPSPASWDSTRRLFLLRGWASSDQIQLLRDSDNNKLFYATEATAIESPGVDPFLQSPSLTFDASDRPGGGYIRSVGGVLTAVAFHDRSGGGTFGDVANEVVAIEPVTGAASYLGEAAFDPSGRLAYVYYDAGAGRMRAAWDRSGDGDFNDTVAGTPELVTVATTPVPFCFGMTFDTAGRLAVTFAALNNSLQLRRDLDGDGDFDDAGEASPTVGSTNTGLGFACDVGPAATDNRVFVIHNAATDGNDMQARLFLDLNDDGDYLDAGEVEMLLPTPVNGPFAVTKSASGGVRLLTGSGVIVGPVR